MKKSAATRQQILQKAFELIYVNGYQATSIDQIIAETDVTKGAFYYHFKTKEDMGLAVIREVMYHYMSSGLVQPLLNAPDPVEAIYDMMSDLLLANPYLQLKYGCPTYNLVQEMAPLSEQFNEALSRIMQTVRAAMETAVEQSKETGVVRPEVDSAGVADFVMSGYGGVRIIGKLQTTDDVYRSYLKQLKVYLKALR